MVSSRSALATEQDPVSEKKREKRRRVGKLKSESLYTVGGGLK
jgi:hypothetical protein